MKTRVQKWGNSLGVRLPRSVANDAGVTAGTQLDVRLEGGSVVLHPVQPAEPTLEELLAGIHRSNLHGEVDTGPRTGREVW